MSDDAEMIANASRLRELQREHAEYAAKRKAMRETLSGLDREGYRIGEQIERVRRLLLISAGDREESAE